MERTFKAAVIGLGAIGLGYDLQQPRLVATHCRAFHQHPGFKLAAGVDPDVSKRQACSDAYGCPAFASIPEMLSSLQPEVVAVAVPTAQHLEAVEAVAFGDPRLVLCEKPLGTNNREAEEIAETCRRAGAELAVNYIRRFDPASHEIASRIRSRALGAPSGALACYTGTLLNDGSHLIDLLGFWFGAPGSIEVTGCAKPGGVSGVLHWPDGFRCTFVNLENVDYRRFELSLFFQRGRIDYLDSGMRVRFLESEDDDLFRGSRLLRETRLLENTALQEYQLHVADALHRHLAKGEELPCDIESALATSALIDQATQLRTSVN